MGPSTTSTAERCPESEYRYWAFISYSHEDEKWAQWLHTSLETYRIPKALKGHIAGAGFGEGADRLFPVFRDRDELSGGFDLDERLRLALRQSRFMIVICSPHSARSYYVQREIEFFEASGREDRVLCLIVDGEPGAAKRTESAVLECFSPPLRTRHVGDDLVACEPLAADVRKSKDGKTNAKLKIIASMLGVGFGDLKRREDHRRFLQRVRLTLAAAASVLFLAVSYLIALDSGFAAPGGNAFRRWVDNHELSAMRPVPADSAIREKADVLRKQLRERLKQVRDASGSYSSRFDRPRKSPWAHNMTVFALVNAFPEPASVSENAPMLSVNFGSLGSNAIPDLWGFTSLARQIALHPNDAAARTQLEATGRGVERFRSMAEPGGWGIFLSEPEQRPDAYTTTMALMALLEARRAGLPWSGDAERRDELIASSFNWLVQSFRAGADPPGWHAGTSSLGKSADGLTLQVFGRLLDAEHETGLQIPDVIAREIPRHLARINGRPIDFPVATGEFTYDQDGPNEDTEAINFLWYPWALDCAERWLNRSVGVALSTADRLAIQRLLGHLVLDLGDEAVTKATEEFTFSASETLYGLSSIPLPLNQHGR